MARRESEVRVTKTVFTKTERAPRHYHAMNTALLACLSTPFLVQPFGAADLASQPKEGTVIAKSVRYTAELQGGDLEVWMDGQPVPAMYLPELEMEFQFEENMRLVDTYVSVPEGRLEALVRHYDEVAVENTFSMEMTQMDSTQTMESESTASCSLAGRDVRFQRENEDWEVAMEDGSDPGEADLEALTARVDFADWALPAEPEAERWTLPGSALLALVEPGGVLPLEWTGEAPGERLEPRFGGELEFTLTGGGDGGPREVGVSGTVEWVEREKTDLAEVPVADGRATQFTEQELELEGSLVWDVENGHLLSIELSAEVTGKTRIVRDPDQEGASYESHNSLSGEMSWEVQFEVQDD